MNNPDATFDYDAIFALNDDMAIACIDFFQEKGRKVPENLLVTGFDDLRKASFNIPAVSTVSQRVMQQGYVAARTLVDMIMGRRVPPVQKIDCKAILRESTNAAKYISKIKNSDYIELDRASLAGTRSQTSVLEWFNRRALIYRVAKFYADTRANLSEPELLEHLNYGIKSLGIKFAAIVAFDKAVESIDVFEYFHLPHIAYLFSYYDAENQVFFDKRQQQVIFDPTRGILPENLRKSSHNPFIAISLFSGTMQYGYLIVEQTDQDAAYYALLAKSISSLLSAIYYNTEVIRIQEQIRQQCAVLDRITHTDELTGVMNRRGLLDFGQQTLNLEKSMRQIGMLVYCNINGIRYINDYFGHESGDKAIIAEAEIVSRSFRLNDVIARIGGDEFVALCPGLTEEAFGKIQKRIEENCVAWTNDTNSLFVLSLALTAVPFPLENGSYDIEQLINLAKNNHNAKKMGV